LFLIKAQQVDIALIVASQIVRGIVYMARDFDKHDH